jgi:hypothetical protein
MRDAMEDDDGMIFLRRSSMTSLRGRDDVSDGVGERSADRSARLVVGRADDREETSADDMADLIVHALASSPPKSASGLVPGGRVQRSAARHASVGAGGGTVDRETDRSIRLARGGGSPLSATARSSMEGAFGADFGRVRIHEGATATDLNNRIQAKAFTVGSDIFFRDGTPDVSEPSGQHLLAHELGHTIQQGGADMRRSLDGPVRPRPRPARLTIRRMPSTAGVKERSGKKSKSGTKLFGKARGATNTYNALLASLEGYESWKKGTALGKTPSQILEQVAAGASRIGRIEVAARDYLAKADQDQGVTTECNSILAIAPIEKRVLADIGGKWSRKAGNALGTDRPKWILEIPRKPEQHTFNQADMKARKVTVQGGGGKGNNKEVSKVSNADNASGFFAEDDTGAYEDNKKWGNPTWLLNNYGVADQDVRLGNRSIAMSRLDTLLGGGVIARTEAALKGDTLGTFQWGATGLEAKTLLYADTVPKDDKNLPRLLSRLQLIDAIAGQVDRHAGNYFVQRDDTGKVTGITGIDLDMAWVPSAPTKGPREDKRTGQFEFSVEHGSRAKSDGGSTDHYPGFSRFCDGVLADKIIAVQPDDLRVILIDLLDKPSVDAAVTRLVQLQTLLGELKKKGLLIEPNEWNAHVRAQVMAEDKSYYSRFAM